MTHVAQRPSKRQLHVGMVVHSYYESDARVRRYAESLARLGHSVEVLALRAPGSDRSEMLDGVRVDRASIARRRGGVLRYLFEYAAFLTAAFVYLARGCLRRRYDIVHVHNMPDILVLSAIVPKILGARVILDVHDLMPELFASKYGTSLAHPGILILRVQEIIGHLFANRVIFATALFRAAAIARGTVSARCSIAVMNMPDLSVFDSKRSPWIGPEDPTELRILYVGTVSRRHGLDQLVRAMALASARVPRLTLHVYPKFGEGEGEPLAEVLTLAEELGVRERIEIKEPVPLPEMAGVMSSASIGAFTPHIDMHMDVALSLKLPEYIAMDLPVLTTRTRITEVLLRDGEAMQFDDCDYARIAELLVQAHADTASLRGFAARARSLLERRAWEREFGAYCSLLEGCVGNPVSVTGAPRQAACS